MNRHIQQEFIVIPKYAVLLGNAAYEKMLKEMYISDDLRRLLHCIDVMPNAYQIAKKWNLSDHDSRVKDGSLTYDYFNVSEGKIEYSISRCVYVEMFEQYGIRSLCRIFCMTDTTSYENLPKHVRFIRHSDLSDGSILLPLSSF